MEFTLRTVQLVLQHLLWLLKAHMGMEVTVSAVAAAFVDDA